MTQDAKTLLAEIEALADLRHHGEFRRGVAVAAGKVREGATNDLLTKLWFIAGKLEPSVREDIASIIVALRAALTRNAVASFEQELSDFRAKLEASQTSLEPEFMAALAATPYWTDPASAWKEDVDTLIREIAELDDRTSPADYPEHLLVTPDELRQFARDVATLSAPTVEEKGL